MTNSQNISTTSIYLNLARKIAILNNNQKYFNNGFDLLNSQEMELVVTQFLSSEENQISSIQQLDAKTYITMIKQVLTDQSLMPLRLQAPRC